MNNDISSYNWTGVLQFLYSEYQKVALKENIWFLEKKELTDQIKTLEGKLAATETSNADLRNRNNMLEYCLRQLKGKNQSGQKQKQPQQIPIPQRRPTSNKNHISKILSSLGINNVLQNINRDIKIKVPQNSMKIEIPIIDQKKQESFQNSQKSGNYKQIAHLENHQDGVRDLCFLNDKNYLVSVSEDSTMKIWNIQKPKEKIDCLSTIRQHSGPIFTAIEGQGLLFTGGMEGIIRCWNFPRKINSQSQKKYLVGSWNNSEDEKLEPIWQLVYNSEKKLIFSSSSEIAIRAFHVQIEQNTVSSRYKGSYVYQSKNSQEQDIPTAICIHLDSLYAGYVNSNALIEFNLQTQKSISSIEFPSDGQVSTNRIVSNSNILAGAFQDCMIRIFDKSKVIHSFQAHDEPVMSLCFTQNPFELVSCGQDGMIKMWDLRKYTQLFTFHAHTKKYDQAAHCISSSRNGLLSSGGADGIIKIFGV